MESCQFLTFLLDFTNKEELQMGNNKRQKHTLLPKRTPTQRLHSPTTGLKFMTSCWGALVMLSKMETCF